MQAHHETNRLSRILDFGHGIVRERRCLISFFALLLMLCANLAGVSCSAQCSAAVMQKHQVTIAHHACCPDGEHMSMGATPHCELSPIAIPSQAAQWSEDTTVSPLAISAILLSPAVMQAPRSELFASPPGHAILQPVLNIRI